ncbi:hypothetical protein THAOC_05776, partial [Thalassiosira oceanica]
MLTIYNIDQNIKKTKPNNGPVAWAWSKMKAVRLTGPLAAAAVLHHVISPVLAAPVISDLNQLEYDENGRLAGHVFAYPTGECAHLIEGDSSINDGMWGHKFAQLSGQAYEDVFGHLEGGSKTVPDNVKSWKDDCFATCLEKGTLQGKKLDEDEEIQINRLSDFLTSDSCGKVEYGFVNYHENNIK